MIYPVVDLAIPPLSVNRAWQGRRFKTKEYDEWRSTGLLLLKRNDPLKQAFPQELQNTTTPFGLSLVATLGNSSDIDNITKPILDLLALYYGFNDKRIDFLIAQKKRSAKRDVRSFSFCFFSYSSLDKVVQIAIE